MWGDIAIAFLLAFITAFVITPYTIRLAIKVGAVDVPSDRRVNKKPMPRLGGLAVISGFLVSMIYLIISMAIEGKINFLEDNLYIKLAGVLLGMIILGITCYIDDVKGIKPLTKLAGQTLAAIVVVQSGVLIDNFTIPFKENSIVLNEVFSYILTIGWIVGITNAINLIDGLDGLSSGITLISCISLLIIFALNESPLIAIVLITALAGSIVGFLPYNFNPAKTFIGDVGSNFMGFALSIISILGVAKTYTAIVLIAPIIVLALPIFDTLWAIIRRIVKTKSIKGVFKADKGHLHHRLMAKGFSQKQSVLILYGITAILGMTAVILLDSGIWKAISFALLVVAIIAIGYKDIKQLGLFNDEENNHGKGE
ncbi:MAG: glycosyltransferase family 4 protein [Clostridia bacterium]